MLKKLSQLSYKIDNSSTVTVNLGNGEILKMSPTEILCIADEIVKKQQVKTRLVCADSIYENTLKALDIPDEIVDKIKHKLHGKSQIIKETQEERINAKQNTKVDKEHEMLYKFITAFVNSNTIENEFDTEEFSVFGFNLKDIPDILDKYGFETKLDGDKILIRLVGENTTHEKSAN